MAQQQLRHWYCSSLQYDSSNNGCGSKWWGKKAMDNGEEKGGKFRKYNFFFFLLILMGWYWRISIWHERNHNTKKCENVMPIWNDLQKNKKAHSRHWQKRDSHRFLFQITHEPRDGKNQVTRYADNMIHFHLWPCIYYVFSCAY